MKNSEQEYPGEIPDLIANFPSDRKARIRVGFQGNPGSFSHLAAELAMPGFNQEIGDRNSHMVGFDTVAAFNAGRVAELFLPIHNNNSGRVTDMHGLLNKIHGWIAHEYYLHVVQYLLVKPGTRMEQIKEVCSQEPAIKQCLGSIKAEGFQVTYTNDTAAAAEQVRKSKRRDLAAIASESAGRLHGLENLGPFNDNLDNYTRFLHFVRPSQITQALRPVHEKCRTTFFLSGDLYPDSGRSPFSVFSENRVKIKRNEGILPDFDAHEAIIDALGHNKSPLVDKCLKELSRMGLSVRILCCYRTAGPGLG